MISNVYMKHAKVSLERPKKVDRAMALFWARIAVEEEMDNADKK